MLKVATPIFSPAMGTYYATQSVTISDTASGAVIWYTTDGTTPVPGEGTAVQYTGTPIAIHQTTVVKAVATVTNWTNSSTGSATYTLKVSTPTFSPAMGTYSTSQSVTISDITPSAVIWYTTDGTTPVPGEGTAVQYTGTPVAVNQTTTVKAVAAITGWTTSNLASAAYTLKVATPTFSPAAGTYTAAQSVTISDSNSSAVIWYTTDNTTPVVGGGGSTQQYTGAISVTSTTTIKAIAAITGWTSSNLLSGTFTIR
jgi:Chitobiase/beta-hexosaminidase C-terminal domain